MPIEVKRMLLEKLRLREPNSLQKVLELKSIAARISFLKDILTRGTVQ